MATISDIVKKALRKCGIRDTSNTTYMAEGLAAFNDMIKSWEEILQHAPIHENFTLTAGTESYTIGTGGDFNTDRPMRIVSAFIRDSGGVDYPVQVTLTRKEYDEISDKDASARPTALYYAPENPLGIIYFNTAPNSAEDVYLTSNKPLSVYSSLDNTLLLPLEYEKPLIFNLAIDLAPEHNVQINNTVYRTAEVAKNSLAIRNSRPISSGSYDKALLRK